MSLTAPDPLALSRRRTRAVLCVCVAAVAASAAWSLNPVAVPAIEAKATDPDRALLDTGLAADTEAAPIDLAVFDAPLWRIVEAPPPPAPKPVVQAPPPPPPPLKLQLLGIRSDGDQRRAVLYDPDQDRVFIVASGESIAGREVDSITEASVLLRDRSGVRTLALTTGRAP